jgi:uncharacterized OB-fold protein
VSQFSVHRSDDTNEFFDATGRGTLLIRRCRVCESYEAPATEVCPRGHELDWVAASGNARLITWGIRHETPDDPVLATPDGTSCAFGLVELQEGPWMQVPIVGVDPASLAEGAEMTVRFLRPGEGEAIPAFSLV